MNKTIKSSTHFTFTLFVNGYLFPSVVILQIWVIKLLLKLNKLFKQILSRQYELTLNLNQYESSLFSRCRPVWCWGTLWSTNKQTTASLNTEQQTKKIKIPWTIQSEERVSPHEVRCPSTPLSRRFP